MGRHSLADVGYMFTGASVFIPHEVAWCLMGAPLLSPAGDETWSLRVQNFRGAVLMDWTDPPVIPSSLKRYMCPIGEENGSGSHADAEPSGVVFSKRTLQGQRVLVGMRHVSRAPRSEEASLGACVWPLRVRGAAHTPIIWAGAFFPGMGHVAVTETGSDTTSENLRWFQLGSEDRGAPPQGVPAKDPELLRRTDTASWSRCVSCVTLTIGMSNCLLVSLVFRRGECGFVAGHFVWSALTP